MQCEKFYATFNVEVITVLVIAVLSSVNKKKIKKKKNLKTGDKFLL